MPTSNRGLPTARRLDADLLSRADIDALLEACPSSWVGQRNRVLLTVAWRTGLRCSELLDLRWKDVDIKEHTLVVQRGKGGRRRIIGIDGETVRALTQWLPRRSQDDPTNLVFSTRRGGRLDPSYLRHLLPRLAERAGLSKRVHMHALRHRYAVELEQEGAPLSVIRDLLGHSSIATTDSYLRRAGASRAIAFARARAWEVGHAA